MFPDLKSRAYLISNATDIRYLTGFIGAEPDAHEVYLLIYRATCYLFTNSLYLERANRIKFTLPAGIKKYPVETVQISRVRPLWQELKSVCKTGGIQTVEFEPRDLSVSEYSDLKNHIRQVKFRPFKDDIGKYRSIKTDPEINSIRIAVAITDLCYDYIAANIKPGITEAKLAAMIDLFLRRHHAKPAFDPIVAFGTHTSQPHYIPGSTKLSKNTLILCDFGASFNGYASDMTRMFHIGKIPGDIQKAYQTVLNAQEKAIGMLTTCSKPCYLKKDNSFSGACLDRAAKNYIKKSGYTPYSHSLGHGMGLSIHEYPRLTIHQDMKIRPGMVFSLEPGIYEPGQFGIRIEDTVYFSDLGLEILTKSSKELAIIS
jgi:Xaa-Pro aminopeptidase